MRVGLLFGAIILSTAFGSLHAFSVLALPLQNVFDATRTSISFGYALAIFALTTAVYVAPFVMRRLSPAVMAVACSGGAFAGLVLAGSGLGVVPFLTGYGLMFGFANGIAYSLFLERAVSALSQQKGFALGLVTAAYGGGAALFAPVLGWTTAAYSVFATLILLAVAILICGFIAAFLFSGSAFAAAEGERLAPAPQRGVLLMWTLYFLASLGGLMTIGHAAPLLESDYPGTTQASFAVLLVALGNIAGSIGGGLWAQHSPRRYALALPILVSSIAIAVLMVARDEAVALSALCAVGLGYGGLIAAVPVVVLGIVGASGFAAAFGRIFSAWGAAGLTGPTIAGLLFDRLGTYAMPLAFALIAALAALGLALQLFERDSRDEGSFPR